MEFRGNTLANYLRIFNFISKVLYYHTNTQTRRLNNSLGVLRKECCTDLIDTDIILNSIKETTMKKKDVSIKFKEMYTDIICKEYAFSIVIADMSTETPVNIVEYNRPIFIDTIRRVYIIIDSRILSSNPGCSCADYIEEVLCKISSSIGIGNATLNALMANLLYKDTVVYKDSPELGNINIFIDKLMGVAIDENTEYLSLNTSVTEQIRDIFSDYLNLMR